MICPFCTSTKDKVVDSRESDDGRVIRRRRECLKCAKRYTTHERVETLDLLVIKKDGQREPFDRAKVRAGIIKACEKRPVSAEAIDKVVDSIESTLRRQATTEIQSKKIGLLVMNALKRLDKVAYIRFASVYRQFADVEDFAKELKKLGS
ncbi:MAG TPA: transcriptional regulator NrdR [Patescibacteria group bacterium]